MRNRFEFLTELFAEKISNNETKEMAEWFFTIFYIVYEKGLDKELLEKAMKVGNGFYN